MFLGTVVNPRRTFLGLEQDNRAAYHGALVLLLVSVIYTLILLVFINEGYPAAAPSALGLPVEQQYRWQIWYQTPLFFATTALTAWLLAAVSRYFGNSGDFGTVFGRVSLATAVPFALTTTPVEFGIALLVAIGLLEPDATLSWLTGSGAWFASLYQLVGLVWLGLLMVIAVKTSGTDRGWVSTVLDIVLVLVYGLPIALFIR